MSLLLMLPSHILWLLLYLHLVCSSAIATQGMPTLLAKGGTHNPSYIRFPHSLKVPEETPHTLPPEFKLISVIKGSWVKEFFQSDWYHKLKKSPKIIKTKISNYQDLQSDIKDLSKWTLQIIKGKLSENEESDDESDEESDYQNDEEEYNDWDKDPEYFKSFAPSKFQIDQFIDYLVEEHGFELEDLLGLYEADYNDVDMIVDEIYRNQEEEIIVDIIEPDFGNHGNRLLVSYLGLAVCIVSFVFF